MTQTRWIYTESEVVDLLSAIRFAIEEYATDIELSWEKKQDPPEWIDRFKYLAEHWYKFDGEPHMGDCTNMPCACTRCWHEEDRKEASRMLIMWNHIRVEWDAKKAAHESKIKKRNWFRGELERSKREPRFWLAMLKIDLGELWYALKHKHRHTKHG